MKYQEIQKAIKQAKESHEYQGCTMIDCGRFIVLSTNTIQSIIVDRDIADDISKRSWCLCAGYPAIQLNGELVRLHDVVMSYAHEKKPDGCYVDHINQDKLDNRSINLRFVSPDESSHNMPLKSNNKTGITGVCRTKNGTYRAYITVNKQRIELGTYNNIQDAQNARKEAEDRFGFKTRVGTIRELCNFTIIGKGDNDSN